MPANKTSVKEPKATSERITLKGEKRARVVYVGTRGGKYLKKDGKFVSFQHSKKKQTGGYIRNINENELKQFIGYFVYVLAHPNVPIYSDLSKHGKITNVENSRIFFENNSFLNIDEYKYYDTEKTGILRPLKILRLYEYFSKDAFDDAHPGLLSDLD